MHAALQDLGFHDEGLAAHLADCYLSHREQHRTMIPGSLDAIKRLKESGARLALITNGGAHGQRSKIVRFGLATYFDGVFIEGELGFGNPDRRVYRMALDAIGTRPGETWSVGDNLEWDVTVPQRFGLFGIWVNPRSELFAQSRNCLEGALGGDRTRAIGERVAGAPPDQVKNLLKSSAIGWRVQEIGFHPPTTIADARLPAEVSGSHRAPGRPPKPETTLIRSGDK